MLLARGKAGDTDRAKAALARARDPLAVFLDVRMPGTDGWQVLHRLKSDASTRHIPVVMCSVVAHGVSDTPGAEWIGRRAEERERRRAAVAA